MTFKVTNIYRMSSILEIFSILDNIRWNEESNYNLINYFKDDLTDDEKILTHWLCYIMDRQMSFERIWDIGGYIISHLVHTYTKNSNKNVNDIIKPYIKLEGNTVRLKSPLVKPNIKLERYGITGDSVFFASRYIPEDSLLIYRTLGILDKIADRSIARFICLALKERVSIEKNIKQITHALYQLTYAAGGPVSGAKFEQRREEIDREVADFKLELDTKRSLFKKKRLWCSLRDYLKSPEFNPIFVTSLEKANCPNPERWKRDSAELKSALKVLELPGDVWNNAKIFRECLFKPYISNERKTWDMPRTIREIYKSITQTGTTCFYPEQLDVSFDFVPRMCQNTMCSTCLFGDGIKQICHKNKDLICPVVLHSCGYIQRCDPSHCGLKKDTVKGFCNRPN